MRCVWAQETAEKAIGVSPQLKTCKRCNREKQRCGDFQWFDTVCLECRRNGAGPWEYRQKPKLEVLHPQLERIVRLREQAGLSYAEIATRVGIAYKATVRSLYQRYLAIEQRVEPPQPSELAHIRKQLHSRAGSEAQTNWEHKASRGMNSPSFKRTAVERDLEVEASLSDEDEIIAQTIKDTHE